MVLVFGGLLWALGLGATINSWCKRFDTHRSGDGEWVLLVSTSVLVTWGGAILLASAPTWIRGGVNSSIPREKIWLSRVPSLYFFVLNFNIYSLHLSFLTLVLRVCLSCFIYKGASYLLVWSLLRKHLANVLSLVGKNLFKWATLVSRLRFASLFRNLKEVHIQPHVVSFTIKSCLVFLIFSLQLIQELFTSSEAFLYLPSTQWMHRQHTNLISKRRRQKQMQRQPFLSRVACEGREGRHNRRTPGFTERERERERGVWGGWGRGERGGRLRAPSLAGAALSLGPVPPAMDVAEGAGEPATPRFPASSLPGSEARMQGRERGTLLLHGRLGGPPLWGDRGRGGGAGCHQARAPPPIPSSRSPCSSATDHRRSISAWGGCGLDLCARPAIIARASWWRQHGALHRFELAHQAGRRR
jgi:hypothetical protein